jgi:hypothetical protein
MSADALTVAVLPEVDCLALDQHVFKFKEVRLILDKWRVAIRALLTVSKRKIRASE